MISAETNTPSDAPKSWVAKRSKMPSPQRSLRAVSKTANYQRIKGHKSTNDPICPELLSLFSNNSFEQHFQPNSTILLHGESAESMYLVVSGTVRCCTIDDDGSRQIFSFAKKGDFIGISDIYEWHFTAEAVDHVVLKSIPRDIVERQLKVNIALSQEFRSQTCSLLARREKQLLSFISKKAPDRLFHFLCDFALSRSGAGNSTVALPMCRRDIADHLGLSVETVSRAFTDLKLKGRIELATAEKYRVLQGIDSATLKAVDLQTV